MGMEQLWGERDHFVKVEAVAPAVIWVERPRRKNTDVGSVREMRAEGCFWASSAQKSTAG